MLLWRQTPNQNKSQTKTKRWRRPNPSKANGISWISCPRGYRVSPKSPNRAPPINIKHGETSSLTSSLPIEHTKFLEKPQPRIYLLWFQRHVGGIRWAALAPALVSPRTPPPLAWPPSPPRDAQEPWPATSQAQQMHHRGCWDQSPEP